MKKEVESSRCHSTGGNEKTNSRAARCGGVLGHEGKHFDVLSGITWGVTLPSSAAAITECEHDVVEPYGDGNWGRCSMCGDDSFPITAEAAGVPDPNPCERCTYLATENDRLAARNRELEVALRNVRAMASLMAGRAISTSPAMEDAKNLLRFCREVGITARILRDGSRRSS